MLISAQDSLENIFQTVKHELHRGALDPKHPFRYVSLATHSQSEIDLRYVVLRKLDKELNFYFFSDHRTTKVEQIKNNPDIALLLYHPGKRIQVRIKGHAEIHSQNELSESFWSTVQGEAQKAYNSIIPPGGIIPYPKGAYEWAEDMNDTFFSVIKINPYQIEALQLNGLTHVRARYKKTEKMNDNDCWSSEWMAP